MVKIVDIDKGYERFRRTSRKLNAAGINRVDIGLFEEQGQHLVNKAAANEFGVPELRIPKRSFLRSAADENRNRIINRLIAVKMDAVKGTIPVAVLLKKLGRFGEKLVQAKILTGGVPYKANRPKTLQLKFPETRPLIHTQEMLESIKSDIPKR